MDTFPAVDSETDLVSRRRFITQQEQYTIHNVVYFCGK